MSPDIVLEMLTTYKLFTQEQVVTSIPFCHLSLGIGMVFPLKVETQVAYSHSNIYAAAKTQVYRSIITRELQRINYYIHCSGLDAVP